MLGLTFLCQIQASCSYRTIISVKIIIIISNSLINKSRHYISLCHCLIFFYLFGFNLNFESNYIMILYYSKFILTLINYCSHLDYNNVVSYYKLQGLYDNRNTSKFKRISDYTYYNSLTNNISSCCICLMEFNLGEKLSLLVCKHFFHNTCLANWIKISSKCPYCRTTLKLFYKDHGICR